MCVVSNLYKSSGIWYYTFCCCSLILSIIFVLVRSCYFYFTVQSLCSIGRSAACGRVFTARCTLVQSAVLRLHVDCLSVRLSVCNVVNCDHIGWNSSKLISPLVSLGCSLFATPTWRVCSMWIPLNLGPKWPTRLSIWASETFDRKLRPNGYR